MSRRWVEISGCFGWILFFSSLLLCLCPFPLSPFLPPSSFLDIFSFGYDSRRLVSLAISLLLGITRPNRPTSRVEMWSAPWVFQIFLFLPATPSPKMWRDVNHPCQPGRGNARNLIPACTSHMILAYPECLAFFHNLLLRRGVSALPTAKTADSSLAVRPPSSREMPRRDDSAEPCVGL